jgi:hypothetical protein
MDFANIGFKNYMILSYMTSWIRSLALRLLNYKEHDLTFWHSQASHLAAGLLALGVYAAIRSALEKWQNARREDVRRTDVEVKESSEKTLAATTT